MPKSKSGDGRRGNRPPDEHKIRPGEVRNPYGRGGKPGSSPTSRIDQFILEEAQRIVSRDDHGDVTAAQRLVQEEYFAALFEKDPKARARLLKTLSAIQTIADKELREFTDWFYTCKAKYEELFHEAQSRRLVPPDVAHPSHVHFRDGGLVFTGPLDAPARKQWEDVKSWIKLCAWTHDRTRQDYKRNPTEKNLAELKRLEAHRRRLMRCVPKGWNWRETIYCRYSQARFVRETIEKLEQFR